MLPELREQNQIAKGDDLMDCTGFFGDTLTNLSDSPYGCFWYTTAPLSLWFVLAIIITAAVLSKLLLEEKREVS